MWPYAGGMHPQDKRINHQQLSAVDNTEESTQDPFADIDQEDILVQRIDPDVPLTVWEYATADDVLLVQHL